MKHESREDRLANNYRKVEAMYRKGRSFNEIANSLDLDVMDVYDIVQKIFAMDMRRAERVG